MHLKMISILFIILMSTPIKCVPNWCEFVSKDGDYNGLGIYRFYESNEISNLRLFNRSGAELEFEITSDDKPIKIISNHQMIGTSSRSVFYRFSVFYKCPKKYINCGVFPPLVRFIQILIEI